VDRTGSAGYNGASSASGGDYTDDFGGTSSATPTTAGIAALILEKKPGLGWRDVKEILIRSAAKFSPADADWADNSAGFHFNHKFGAGLVDATAAVNLAATWTNLPAATSQNVAQTGLSVPIPDNNATGITRTFDFNSANLRVEHATLTLSVSHANRGELEVILTSPSGMVSRLAEKHSDNASDYSSWTFTSVRHWGENSAGAWTLRVADRTSGTSGALTAATLTLHGTPGAPINPAPVVQISSPANGTVFSPGATVNVSVMAGDLNPDGSPGTVASVQLLDNGSPVGTVTVAPFAFSFSPVTGSHNLTAVATDGEGKSSTSGAVSISVVDQAPVITAATLAPAVQGFADEAVTITGLTASDPENQTLGFSYAWEKSADSVTWTAAGIPTASLPPAPANAGFLWRCRITANDGTNSSAAFTTAAVNLLARPPASAPLGAPFSYDSGLVLRGTDSPVSRDALINEFSQGASGTSEWVEILTLRQASFRNWKLDDSSGNRLSFADAPIWDAVPAGTVIVIYNGPSKDALLPADDTDFSDGKLVLASNNTSYFGGSWPGFGNGGDAVILKNAADATVAGFSYGSSSVVSPHFGSLGGGDAAYYAGSSDAGASSSSSWTITTSQIARHLRAVGDLFISEYVEGSSNNKVIELYNPSASTVDLATDAYKIEIYANGSSSVNGSPITLAGTVAAGGTFVLKHASASGTINAQQTSTGLSFNGNDAVVNPGSAWSGGGVSTVDKTVRRKASVSTGDTNAGDVFDPSLEWEQSNQDDFSGLGIHGIDGGGGGPVVTVSVSPASFSEAAGASAATGTVTLSAAPAANVSVTLASSDLAAATVPASVTVLTGQTTATFPVAAVDDTAPDGAQTSVISASAAGYTGGNFVVTVTDDEPSLEGVTPGKGNTPGNAAFVADLRSGALNAPALFRFAASAQIPAGLGIDATTGVVSGTPGGTAGSYTIVIERYNTLGEVVSQSFTLELTAGSGYSGWIAGFSGLSSTAPDADPDQDGMVNLLEYHLGSLAGTPDAATSLPVLSKEPATVSLIWWRLKSATDTTGIAQWSDTFGDWQSTGITTQIIADEATREQVKATLILQSGETKKFLRLKVE
jgi:subtilisin-like proprotein convertase family protein